MTITERDCCGLCKDHNTIVVDDTLAISHLSMANLVTTFCEHPEQALERARQEDQEAKKSLDALLQNDEIPL